MKSSTVFVMWTLSAAHSLAQSVPPPIIDMHMHALRATGQGPPPVSLCSPPMNLSGKDPLTVERAKVFLGWEEESEGKKFKDGPGVVRLADGRKA